MVSEMRKSLEEWLGQNFCPLIETTGTLVWDKGFRLNNKKRRVNVVFSRYHQEKDPWEYVILNKGYVLTLPSFWLGIHKDLVIPYIEYYIDGYLDDYVYSDNPDEDEDTDSKPSCPLIPPCHPIPPKPPIGIPGQQPPPPPPVADFLGQLENVNSSCPAGGCADGNCETKITTPIVGLTN